MREPAELKHLSKLRKINQRDYVSSGERKHNRLNLFYVRINEGLREPNVGLKFNSRTIWNGWP